MHFQCPHCKEWPPMSNASFCCYCGVRFSDHKFEPAELASNYRKFAIKYFWFITVPIMLISLVAGAFLADFFHITPKDDPLGSIGLIPFTLGMISLLLHFHWWSRRKFPNYSR